MDDCTTDFSQRVRQTLLPVFVVFNCLLLAVFLYSSFSAVSSFMDRLFLLTANEGIDLFQARFSETERLLKVLGAPGNDGPSALQDSGQFALLERARKVFNYRALGVADNEGGILGISPAGETQPALGEFLRAAAREEGPQTSRVFEDKNGEKLFLLSVPLRTGDNTRLGTAFATEYVDQYLQILRRMQRQGEVQLTLLGRSSQVLASTGAPLFMDAGYHLDALFPRESVGLQSGPTLYSQGRLELNRYVALPGLPWQLVVTVNAFEAMSGMAAKQGTLALVYLLSLVGLSWYARSRSRRIAQPVDELMQKARMLGSEKSDESGDVFSFITAAMEATSNIINPTEFFFSIDRRSDKLELAFGDFATLTGHELPKTAGEIRQLFLNLLHPDDVQMYTANHSNRDSGPPDGETTSTFSYRLYSKDMKLLFVQMVETDVFDKDGQLANTMVKLSDMTEQKELETALVLKSETDGATGLFSKQAFESRVREALATHAGLALALLDIDHFKQVNDKHGHLAGDKAIQTLAKLLQSSFRANDVVGRVGGDEFAVLCLDVQDPEKLQGKFSRLVNDASQQLSAALGGHTCSISVGVAVPDEENYTFEKLYANADSALYNAKNNGKNQCRIYGNQQSAGEAPSGGNASQEAEVPA